DVLMSFHGLDARQAREVWAPLLAQLGERPDRFAASLKYLELPGDKMWSREFAERNLGFPLEPDSRPDGNGELFWCKANQGEVATYWYAYQSRWIRAALCAPENAKAFARILFDAPRHWSLELYFSKGQASASAEALRRDRETSVNPVVYRAAALMII